MEFLSKFALMGAAQGFILTLAIVSLPYGNRRANRVLAAFIGVETIYLAVMSLVYDPIRPPFAVFYLLNLSHLFGPLLYLYVRSLVAESRPPSTFWPHFWLPLLLTAISLTGMDPANFEQVGRLYTEHTREARVGYSLHSLPSHLLFLGYSIASLRYLQRHRHRIEEEFSDLVGINLRWLTWLVLACLVMSLSNLMLDSLGAFAGVHLSQKTISSVIFNVLIIGFIGVMGLRQPLIFDQGQRYRPVPMPAAESALIQSPIVPPDSAHSSSITIDAETPDGGKYEKSGLRDADVEKLWRRLQTLMSEQRPYLQPGIKLADLAKLLHVRNNYLSQVINSCAQSNFYDFINGYRVAAVEVILIDPKQASLPMPLVAERAGFSSQNAFNSHFKKRTGETPVNYRRSRQAP